ncbi:hypothetical protein BDZ91DRAFT_715549 [Kalaharituber pfeilii]|nr:hypothetical protein BDZ91DRAFT_715549 [Kalaharituber pfeilii]
MTSTLHCTTIMAAELNPHDILTPDLLLAIGIEITEYMLLFYNQTPVQTSALQGICTYRRSIFQQTCGILWKVHFGRSLTL